MPRIIVAAPDSQAQNLPDTVFIPTAAAPLPEPLMFHADMQFHYLGNRCAVVCPELFDYYDERLSKLNIKILCGETPLKSTYPEDIAYNVARVSGEYALHRADKTDRIISECFKKQSVTLINVSQGYTKCSVAPVAENAFITSDRGIYKTACEYKMDVLLVSEGNVELEPYPYGFIGGCCGLISKHEMLFEGSFAMHPDRERIIKFLEKHGVTALETSGKNLRDIGSIICIY